MAPTTRSTTEATDASNTTPAAHGGTAASPSPNIGARLFAATPLGKAAADWYAKKNASKPKVETVYFEDDDDGDTKPAPKPVPPGPMPPGPKPSPKPVPKPAGSDSGNAASGGASASGLGNKAPDTANAVAPSLNLAALTQILAALNQDASTSRKSFNPPVKPRVGGVDEIGAWTGKGAREEGLSPRTNNCYRKLCGDPVKSLGQISTIESGCRAGLKGINGPLFRQEHETGAEKVITVLMALESFLEAYGLESVFIMEFHDCKINMLKSPSQVSDYHVLRWLQCLLDDGVDIDAYHRRAVCPYDRHNLELSYDAVINSCSDDLARELKGILVNPTDRNGVSALREIIKIRYHHNEFKLNNCWNN